MANILNLDVLLDKYANGYDDPSRSWAAVFNGLMSEPSDKETVNSLVAELLRDGQFRSPVVLSPDDDEDGLTVWNGHHRLLAHHITGHKDVKVQYGWTSEDVVDSFSFIEVSADAGELLDDTDIDAVFDHMRSFRVSDSLWLEASSSMSEGVFFFSFLDQNDVEDMAVVEEATRNRLGLLLSKVGDMKVKAKFTTI